MCSRIEASLGDGPSTMWIVIIVIIAENLASREDETCESSMERSRTDWRNHVDIRIYRKRFSTADPH